MMLVQPLQLLAQLSEHPISTAIR